MAFADTLPHAARSIRVLQFVEIAANLVSTLVLGLVQCQVCTLQHRGKAWSVFVQGAEPDARSESDFLGRINFNDRRFDCQPNSLSNRQRCRRIHFVQNNGKLLAPEAPQAIDIPQLRLAGSCKGLDNLVACSMAVGVIDGLEEVDVQHGVASENGK